MRRSGPLFLVVVVALLASAAWYVLRSPTPSVAEAAHSKDGGGASGTEGAASADAPNDLTHSALRFARHWQARNDARCEGADCGSPHAKVGGVSYRWFNQSCFASEQARGKAAANIAVPVLLLQGENDTVVKPSAQQEFCRNVNDANGPGYCVGRTVKQALHSILIEADAYRGLALQRVLGFFDCVRKGAPRCD